MEKANKYKTKEKFEVKVIGKDADLVLRMI